MSQTQLTYVVVRSGDTLESIAARYKSSVATIARLNSLKREEHLTPGMILQVLKRPPEPAYKNPSPPRPREPRYAFAFTTGQEGVYPGSHKSLVREGQEGVTGIFPLWFQVSPTEPWRLQTFASDTEIQETLQVARERNVRVLPMLTNLYYRGVISGKEVAHQAMATHRHELLQSIAHTWMHYQFDGLLLDWSDLYTDDRQLLTDWVITLGDLCRNLNIRLVVQVPLVQEREVSPSVQSFDLREIGRAADLVALMLNTEHRMYTSPGALSSLDWTEGGVRSAIEQGLPAGKILLGIAGYAYDWKGNNQVPEYLSFEGAMNRARQYRVNVQFDQKSQTPMYRYQDSGGVEHQVWFENTSSLSQKITVVNRHNLAGISLWRLGIEDSNLWPLLRSRWGAVRKWKSSFHNISYDK